MGRPSKNPFQIHFGKKFYLQTYGYWVFRTKEYTFLAHRWVWENHNGPIPDNMDVHHIDGNKANNELENLMILSRSDHRKEHWQDENLRVVALKQLDSVRPIEWLQSNEGRKTVSEKGKQIWKERKEKIIICEECGVEKAFKRWARFCCKACYMKWRWKNVLKKSRI